MSPFDFSRTSIRADRPLTSYTRVQYVIGWILRSQKAFARPPADGALIDIGCGPKLNPKFYGIDYSWRPGLGLCWDITKPLPIPSNIAGGVFTEHCLEHIPFSACMAATKEIYRIMKLGAGLRIVVPDAELYIQRYMGGEPMPYADRHFRGGFYTPVMTMNDIFYNHGHRFIYDFTTMAKILELAGFRQIERASLRQGGDPRLHIDTETRAVESIYITALK